MSGASSAFFTVPVYSEIVDPSYYELGVDENVINDLAASLSTISYYLGDMVGYVVGGYTYSKVGFSSTIDYLTLCILGLSVLYFV